jgi:hypothetical protein
MQRMRHGLDARGVDGTHLLDEVENTAEFGAKVIEFAVADGESGQVRDLSDVAGVEGHDGDVPV